MWAMDFQGSCLLGVDPPVSIDTGLGAGVEAMSESQDLFEVERPVLGHQITPFSGDPLLRWLTAGSLQSRLVLGPILLVMVGVGAGVDGNLFALPESASGAAGGLRYGFIGEAFGPVVTLLVLPVIVLFIRRLHREIPKVLSALFLNRILLMGEEVQDERLKTATRRLNHPICFVGTVLFSGWLISVLSAARFGGLADQIGVANPYIDPSGTAGFGAACLLAIVVSHLFIATLWRISVSGHFIYESFLEPDNVRLQPAHGDRCCGVRFLGSFTLFTSSYLMILPLTVGGMLLVYPQIYEVDAIRYGFVYVGLVGYAVTAAVLFLGPTMSVHRVMESSREESLQFLNDRFLDIYDEVFERLQKKEIDSAKLEEEVGILNNIKSVVSEVQTRNIWPFNVKLTLEFVGIVLLPILPVFVQAAM